MQDLLNQKPVVMNIGLQLFSEDLEKQHVENAQVNWSPSPAFQKEQEPDAAAMELLDGLF